MPDSEREREVRSGAVQHVLNQDTKIPWREHTCTFLHHRRWQAREALHLADVGEMPQSRRLEFSRQGASGVRGDSRARKERESRERESEAARRSVLTLWPLAAPYTPYAMPTSATGNPSSMANLRRAQVACAHVLSVPARAHC